MIKQIGVTCGGDKKEYIGLSTDIKPIDCGAGSMMYETDTKLGYVFDGDAWCNL